MSNFPQKRFDGMLYTFEHLEPLQLKVPLNAEGSNVIDLHITFGCHCFTEGFDPALHRDPHRYTYRGELRAFDVLRYECSLQLPQVMQSMLKGTIYNAEESYTYVAHITLESVTGPQSYSVFFSLERNTKAAGPALRMFVKSAYLKPLVARPNAQSWRFPSLAGHLSGAFPPKAPKPRPTKKPKVKKAA